MIGKLNQLKSPNWLEFIFDKPNVSKILKPNDFYLRFDGSSQYGTY